MVMNKICSILSILAYCGSLSSWEVRPLLQVANNRRCAAGETKKKKKMKLSLLYEDIGSIHGSIEPCIVKSLNRFCSKLQSLMSQILNFTKKAYYPWTQNMERLLKTSKTRRTFEPFFSSQRNDDGMLFKGAVFCALCFGLEKLSLQHLLISNVTNNRKVNFEKLTA